MPNTKTHTMNWDDVRFFLAAARHGSLTGASRAMGSNQPTVGRRIDALETSTGVRLFQRHAQGLTLTDEGRRILNVAEAMEDAARALRLAPGKHDEVQGKIGLALPEGLSAYLIAPQLSTLIERHPGLDVSLLPSSASADLIHGEADLAIRLFLPVENDLSARKVGKMGFGVYASPAYFERYGNPRNEKELTQHQFIVYGEKCRHTEEGRWLEAVSSGCRLLLRSDDTHTRLAATVSGLGLTVLPHFLAEKVQLKPIAMATAIPPRTVYLVVHRHLRKLTRVRATLDWLVELLRETFPQE